MTDARWADVEDEIERATRHYGLATRLFDAGGFDAAEEDDLDLYRNQMALQHAMQAAHTTLETALRRILEILAEEAPSGPSSHADLVSRVSKSLRLPGRDRPAILSPEVEADVTESRRFRHRATHDYDSFDPAHVGPSIEAARRLTTSLWPCIKAFRDLIDPPAPLKTLTPAPPAPETSPAARTRPSSSSR